MDFVGQRADKAIVIDILNSESVEGDNGILKNGVLKDVKHYTVTCDECGGHGYYDQRGEIICEGCGMVLSGDRPAVIQTEYSEGGGDEMGHTRGIQTPPGGGAPGTHEPSQDYYE